MVADPNREQGAEPEAMLRQCFARLRQDKAASLAGVDQVRPVTFSGEDVILEPTEAPELQECQSSASLPLPLHLR